MKQAIAVLYPSLPPQGIQKEKEIAEGEIPFKAGSFAPEELKAILNTIPIDITSIYKNLISQKIKYLSGQKQLLTEKTRIIILKKVEIQ